MTAALRRCALVLLGICASSVLDIPARAESPAPAEAERLVVFAATSLQEAFAALGDAFESARPGVDVTFSFAGTQQLRSQLEHGAPVDVFASADRKHMDELEKASRVTSPVVIARNEPVIVISRESAAKIRKLADLPLADRIVIGAPEVPIGRYTAAILDRASAGALGVDYRARVEAKVASRELNVHQVLAKVLLGEADAGIVYRTDARAMRDGLSLVTIPLDVNVVAEYPIAIVSDSKHPVLASAWIDFVMSAEGQRLLGKAGFMPPSGGIKRK